LIFEHVDVVRIFRYILINRSRISVEAFAQCDPHIRRICGSLVDISLSRGPSTDVRVERSLAVGLKESKFCASFVRRVWRICQIAGRRIVNSLNVP
jgi:hypothetical protein